MVRKRTREEMEVEQPTEEPSTLQRLRNMWEFANLMQYIFLFGDAVKVDKDLDIEELETECLKPQPSERLAQIGLALLKNVSSHKGLTPQIFDEYTRRQYVAKAPERNPFGTDEVPNKFDDFDIYTKIRVLQQLSVWTLNNPNPIREKIGATESEQLDWRMEPLSWDRQDRTYFVLDDSRLYRMTNPTPPAPKTKPKPKSRKSRGTRSSKRRKVASPEPEEDEENDDTVHVENVEPADNGLGGAKWECLCITLEEYQEFMETIRKSRDPNEKVLYDRLEAEVLPAVIEQAEEQQRKEARKQKELEVLQKMAMAKRSTRISARMEKQKEVDDAAEAERRHQADLAMAKAEQEKQRKAEEARESRMMTREQRLKEREVKRILQEEELKRLEENSEKLGTETAEGRLSERHLKAEMKKRKEELEKLAEEEDWVFDCAVCGLHGENLDDGSHSIQCEKCNSWQHSKCHGITVAQAERDDFHFVCEHCKRKEEEAKMPKLPPLKFRLTSSSPKIGGPPTPSASNGVPNAPASFAPRGLDSVQIPVPHTALNSSPRPSQPLMNGPSLSPRGQALGPPGIHRSEAAYGVPMNGVNVSSPPVHMRPYSVEQSGYHAPVPASNGFPSSSPPPFHSPQVPPSAFNNQYLPRPQMNGSPYAGANAFPHGPAHPAFSPTFNSQTPQKGSPAPNYHSPVKHSPAATPQQTNGIPNSYAFARSPSASFPPSSAQRPSFSPVKPQSPPHQRPVSAHAPSHMPSSPAQLLPSAETGISPEKHDGARPISSHSISETPVFPPVKSLSPNASPQIRTPPVKKATPEKMSFEGANGGVY